MPGGVASSWIRKAAGSLRSLELHHSYPQLGTIIFMLLLYSCGLLDTVKGLGRQFKDMKLKVDAPTLCIEADLFKDNKGTVLVRIEMDGAAYMGLDRYKSSAWYILDIHQRCYISKEDPRYNKLVSVLNLKMKG